MATCELHLSDTSFKEKDGTDVAVPAFDIHVDYPDNQIVAALAALDHIRVSDDGYFLERGDDGRDVHDDHTFADIIFASIASGDDPMLSITVSTTLGLSADVSIIMASHADADADPKTVYAQALTFAHALADHALTQYMLQYGASNGDLSLLDALSGSDDDDA